MLAQAVRERFSDNELILTDVTEGEGVSKLDITDAEGVKKFVQDARPEAIINCAAYTNVDGAEENGALAEKINAAGPENLAKAAAEIGALLIHISTDYVFGGGLDIASAYSEDDAKAPDTVYGKTKLKGEEGIVENCVKYYIFRTAWLYGNGGKNFVDTMLLVGRSASSADTLLTQRTSSAPRSAAPASSHSIPTESIVTVVCDQHGSPTYAKDLADVIYQAVTMEIPYGIYNATNEGFTTWAEFTEKIYELAKVNCKVQGISSAEYEAKNTRKTAPRPKNSQMSKEKLTAAGVKIRSWEEALRDYLRKEEYDK